jgi:hypothetical protein
MKKLSLKELDKKGVRDLDFNNPPFTIKKTGGGRAQMQWTNSQSELSQKIVHDLAFRNRA